MNLIILTPEQADQVRGPSVNGAAALEPRETANGNFVLPDLVLSDPAHESHHVFLASLPKMDVSEVEFPGVEGE